MSDKEKVYDFEDLLDRYDEAYDKVFQKFSQRKKEKPESVPQDPKEFCDFVKDITTHILIGLDYMIRDCRAIYKHSHRGQNEDEKGAETPPDEQSPDNEGAGQPKPSHAQLCNYWGKKAG